jgi:Rieske Fe-S protein
MRDQSQQGIDRRHLLAGGIGAAGVVGLAACGDGTSGATEDPIYGGQQGGAATSSTPAASSTTPSPGTTSATGPTLIALADVPVGGAAAAKGADGKPIIVAQPQAGTVVAFSAICTHQGCTVAPDAARLKCPCHGSTFAITDGARVSGPAQLPLTKVEVTVVDGQVVSV